jgi:hypothetical protein
MEGGPVRSRGGLFIVVRHIVWAWGAAAAAAAASGGRARSPTLAFAGNVVTPAPSWLGAAGVADLDGDIGVRLAIRDGQHAHNYYD